MRWYERSLFPDQPVEEITADVTTRGEFDRRFLSFDAAGFRMEQENGWVRNDLDPVAIAY